MPVVSQFRVAQIHNVDKTLPFFSKTLIRDPIDEQLQSKN